MENRISKLSSNFIEDCLCSLNTNVSQKGINPSVYLLAIGKIEEQIGLANLSLVDRQFVV